MTTKNESFGGQQVIFDGITNWFTRLLVVLVLEELHAGKKRDCTQ